jgi:predicted ATP-binding protein involved in virulence
MQDVFITKIHIDSVRHLQNVDILLSAAESEPNRNHLILTGKNGSGKTSVLNAMREAILLEQRKSYLLHLDDFNQISRQKMEQYLLFDRGEIEKPQIEISYSDTINDFTEVMFAFISAARSEIDVPKTIGEIDDLGKTLITRNASRDFYNYMLNLDYQRNGATADGNIELASKLNKWFDAFNEALREIYDCKSLQLCYYRNRLRIEIKMPGRNRFSLNEMSDGYKALLNIYMELLVRLGKDNAVVEYDVPAIVFIDEVETHLHVELQKCALPFLTKMFPNIQFIVATHSPFVMTSLDEAVVFDLEKRQTLDHPSIYSYEAVVEGYLDVGQYSNEMKNKFNRYKALYGKEQSKAETVEFQQLVSELNLVPPASKELYLAFRTMEDKRKR